MAIGFIYCNQLTGSVPIAQILLVGKTHAYDLNSSKRRYVAHVLS